MTIKKINMKVDNKSLLELQLFPKSNMPYCQGNSEIERIRLQVK